MAREAAGKESRKRAMQTALSAASLARGNPPAPKHAKVLFRPPYPPFGPSLIRGCDVTTAIDLVALINLV